MALADYRLYLFVLLQHISLLSQTFQYFFPSIVGTLGYGSIDTLWLTAPVWVSTLRHGTWWQTLLADDASQVRDVPRLHLRDLDVIQDKG